MMYKIVYLDSVGGEVMYEVVSLRGLIAIIGKGLHYKIYLVLLFRII